MLQLANKNCKSLQFDGISMKEASHMVDFAFNDMQGQVKTRFHKTSGFVGFV